MGNWTKLWWEGLEIPFSGMGEKEIRGFCHEMTVRVEKDKDGEVKRLKVSYHMTDPSKLTMGERRQLHCKKR